MPQATLYTHINSRGVFEAVISFGLPMDPARYTPALATAMSRHKPKKREKPLVIEVRSQTSMALVDEADSFQATRLVEKAREFIYALNYEPKLVVPPRSLAQAKSQK